MLNDSDQTKLCCTCKTAQPLQQYARCTAAPDGLQRRCRPCTSEKGREYKAANRERVAEYNRRWRAENPELGRAATESWRARNPERVSATQREWSKRNAEKRQEDARIWRTENAEHRRAAMERWRRENRDRCREHSRRRRARVRGVKVGEIDTAALWEACKGICALCGEQIDRALRWPEPLSPSLDHILPLLKGGSHDQENVQWTHLVCNLRKGTSLL